MLTHDNERLNSLINADNLRKVIDALESGKYTQTRDKLKDRTGYCAYGVVNEVYRETTGNGRWEGDRFVDDLGYASGTGIRHKVKRWLGVPEFEPLLVLSANGSEFTVITANDSLYWSFAQIAEGLRRYYADALEGNVDNVGTVDTTKDNDNAAA